MHGATATAVSDGYYSSLADDPDLAELVDLFVSELPQRIQTLRAAAEKRDWPEVGRLAHQLKGAGGSYGFGQLTPFAAHAESSAKLGASPLDILAAVELLCQACSRVRNGSPS